MGRIKNLKTVYKTIPGNCPICGKKTVIPIVYAKDEDMKGNKNPEKYPAWTCTSCKSVFYKE